MVWSVELDPNAKKELKKINLQEVKRILVFLFERVSYLDDPRSIGEALNGSRFKSLWKYRVGDYRIIVRIKDQISQILVVKIGNRKDIYKDI